MFICTYLALTSGCVPAGVHSYCDLDSSDQLLIAFEVLVDCVSIGQLAMAKMKICAIGSVIYCHYFPLFSLADHAPWPIFCHVPDFIDLRHATLVAKIIYESLNFIIPSHYFVRNTSEATCLNQIRISSATCHSTTDFKRYSPTWIHRNIPENLLTL